MITPNTLNQIKETEEAKAEKRKQALREFYEMRKDLKHWIDNYSRKITFDFEEDLSLGEINNHTKTLTKIFEMLTE